MIIGIGYVEWSVKTCTLVQPGVYEYGETTIRGKILSEGEYTVTVEYINEEGKKEIRTLKK